MSTLIGILSVILVFAVCFLTVVAVKIITAYVKLKKYMNKNEEPERNPKIYYITEKIKPPKRRKRRKKPNVALSGVVITPEEFQRDINS